MAQPPRRKEEGDEVLQPTLLARILEGQFDGQGGRRTLPPLFCRTRRLSLLRHASTPMFGGIGVALFFGPRAKEMLMEILLRRRKGIAKNLTLDCDAAALLPLLSPGHKGHGRLVSELLRQEADRREARARYVATGKPPWRNEDDK